MTKISGPNNENFFNLFEIKIGFKKGDMINNAKLKEDFKLYKGSIGEIENEYINVKKVIAIINNNKFILLTFKIK